MSTLRHVGRAEDTAFLEALGRAVRELREKQGLSQEKFGLKWGIDRTYVSGLERGRRNPTTTMLLRFSNALGVRVSKLLANAERAAD